jgi:hypothetical protein
MGTCGHRNKGNLGVVTAPEFASTRPARPTFPVGQVGGDWFRMNHNVARDPPTLGYLPQD